MSDWWGVVKEPKKKPRISVGFSSKMTPPSKEMEEDIEAVVEENMKETTSKDKFLDHLRTRSEPKKTQPEKKDLPDEYYEEGLAS
jgi:hypothetical protein